VREGNIPTGTEVFPLYCSNHSVLSGRTCEEMTNQVIRLGLHLDRRLTWRTHINAKRKQLELSFKRMYWIMGRHSQMSIGNKLLLYKTILRPIWTYGIPLLGHGLSIQYYNTTTLPKQSITNNSECTVVHTQQSPTHRSAHINSSRRSYETRHHP